MLLTVVCIFNHIMKCLFRGALLFAFDGVWAGLAAANGALGPSACFVAPLPALRGESDLGRSGGHTGQAGPEAAIADSCPLTRQQIAFIGRCHRVSNGEQIWS
jgi:hypothetical protein